jgi:hypothetical protein
VWIHFRETQGLLCITAGDYQFWNYFCKKNVVDSVHGPWTTSGLGPQWTTQRRRHRACWSSASSCSGMQGCRPWGRRGRGECGGPISGLIKGWASVRRPGDSGKGGGGKSSGAGSLGAQNWGKEEWGRRGGRRECRGTFYRVRGGVGRSSDGGDWAAVVVRYIGGGGGCFRRDQPGRWWAVMRGCSNRFGSERGASRGGACTRM